MATWILNFVKSGTPVKKQLGAQARQLFEVGLWGLPPGSQAATKIKPGDRVVAFAGAPERVFLADGVVEQGQHSWDATEVHRYPLNTSFQAGISIHQVSVWSRPLRFHDIWPSLSASDTNAKGHFMQAAYRLDQADGDQLIAAGRSGSPPAAPPVPVAPAPIAPAPAEPTAPAPQPPASADADIGAEAAAFLKLVERINDIPEGARINEETTRALLLNKYFDALGYSGLADIQYGETAQSGNTPDYVLRVDGRPAIAVEAKALGIALRDREAGQVTGYCGTLGVRWGLLTDGRFMKLYDAHVLSPSLDDRLVFELDLTDYRSPEEFEISIWSTVQMLSKQNMDRGHELDRYATQEMARRVMTDPGSSVVAAMQNELARQKVTLSNADVAQLIRGLISS